MAKYNFRYTVSLVVFLALFWLGNSGLYSGLLLTLGALSILLVLWVSKRLDIVDEEAQPIHLGPRIIGYWFWLLKQIVESNISVVKKIWLGKDSLAPVTAELKMSQTTDTGKTIYGNSITLTPGTITLDINGDMISVYALTYDAIEYLQGGEMDRRVKRLED